MASWNTDNTIHLMVFHDDGGHCAIIHAPNPRPPIRFSINQASLRILRQAIDNVEADGLITGPGSPEADRNLGLAQSIQNLCEQVYNLIVPDPVRTTLRDATQRELILHLDSTLLDLPWEYMFDGEQYLATKFELARQLITDDQPNTSEQPADGLFKVLQIVDAALFNEFEQQQKQGAEETSGIQLARKPSNALSAAELLEAIQEYSLIHYIGPITSHKTKELHWEIGGALVAISQLTPVDGACAVLVSEHCAQEEKKTHGKLDLLRLAEANSVNGAAHIFNRSDIPVRCRVTFQFQLYDGLNQGLSIGRAVARAREKVRLKWGFGWGGYQLYGDPSLRVVNVSIDSTSAEDPRTNARSEYRQLTIMFCDLVDSTATSAHIGVDEWDEILKLYNQTSARIVTRHGGTVHQYKGDGLVVYFGWPTAFEDSARRAVRAASELAKEFEDGCLEARELLRAYQTDPLKVRIGIHTGPVVVADISGNATATGLAVAYTEQMQHIAPPNRVVISRATYDLVNSHYEVRPLGKKTFKGLSQPKDCFLIEREIDASTPQKQLTPFFGRADELDQLERAWRSVTPGSLSVVLVSGEAGIGKTRLLQEFQTVVRSSDALMFEARCSAYFQNSALYPLTQGLRHLLKISEELSDDEQLDVLESRLPNAHDTPNLIPAVATLLSIPYESRYEKLPTDPVPHKNPIEEALLNWISAASAHKHFCFVIEDVQWMDPNTREILTQLPQKLDGGSIMLLMTHRTEGGDSWNPPLPAQQIQLARVTSDSARSMIMSSPGGERLSESVITLLVEKTDGVPLFIEESTSMAIDALSFESSPDDQQLHRHHAGIHIPATIQDLLTARLDRLGEAKETAQIGSVIGREFSYVLLNSVSNLNEARLLEHLAALAGAGIVTPRMVDSTLLYTFKHALVRDAAYQSLLNSNRRAIHKDIASALEQRNYRNQSEGAQMLAHHYTESGDSKGAIDCWMAAGRQAIVRAAQKEAISHFGKALELLHALPGNTDMQSAKLELRAQLYLGGCHIAIGGYGAALAGDAFQQAERLALAQEDNAALLRARFGLETFHLMRGDFERAYIVGRVCLGMIKTTIPEGPDGIEHADQRQIIQLAQAHLAIGNVLFHQAEFTKSISYLDQCIEICRPFNATSRTQVQDPVVMCRVYKAWYLWESGFPDQALTEVERGVATARQIGYPFSIGFALSFQACIHFFRREYAQVIEVATESIIVCEEHGFRTWLAWSKVLRGRAMSEYDDLRLDGISENIEGLRLWDESDAIVTRPFFLALLAESYHLNGQVDKAIELIRQADETVQQFGERYYEPEINRLFGIFIHDSDHPDSAGESAKRWLEGAISHATKRGMRSSELRALTELVRLEPKGGQSSTAAVRLEKTYEWFSEGLTTGDLIKARNVLAHADYSAGEIIETNTDR
ncbi:MAG: AAA family ATPase [Gammaproteobacteria bacterium]|nr:AAA family ATPase [Gammaproteobacteria bacterium]